MFLKKYYNMHTRVTREVYGASVRWNSQKTKYLFDAFYEGKDYGIEVDREIQLAYKHNVLKARATTVTI